MEIVIKIKREKNKTEKKSYISLSRGRHFLHCI